MTKCWHEKLQQENFTLKKPSAKSENSLSLKSLVRRLSLKDTNIEELFQSTQISSHTDQDFRPLMQKQKISKPKKTESPLVVIISHCKRAVNFHQINGFQAVSEIPYHDDVDDITPFYAYTMILDPLNTGRATELASGLSEDKKSLICEGL